MNEELELILEDAGERMDSSIAHFEKSLTKIRAGKASPMMLDGVMVEYYGTPTALDKVANVMCPDARTITVKPWEKSLLNVIDKAILISNLGFTPANNGEMLIINIPPVTEDRRRELAKMAKAELETAKINIRNIRKDANNSIRRTEDASEDLMKQYEEQVQTLTDKYVARAKAIMAEKEKDIMTVA
jgi:ribosome recycling factor